MRLHTAAGNLACAMSRVCFVVSFLSSKTFSIAFVMSNHSQNENLSVGVLKSIGAIKAAKKRDFGSDTRNQFLINK